MAETSHEETTCFTRLVAKMIRKSENFLKTFDKKTSDATLFRLFWDNKSATDCIVVTPSYKTKDEEAANFARLQGNGFFKKKNFQAALQKYNDAVLLSPHNGTSQELALALANRSAVLFHLERHTDAISDTRAAQRAGYPPDKLHKLLERRTRSYLNIGCVYDAHRSYDDVLKALELSKMTEKETRQFQAVLENIRSSIDTKQHNDSCTCSRKQDAPDVPNVTDKNNEAYPAASDAFSVECSELAGRYVVAARDISVGDVLISESPFASALYTKFFTTHCHHCFSPADVPVPCSSCSGVVFCSEECRALAWEKHHRVECRYMNWLTSDWVGHIGAVAFRMALLSGTGTSGKQEIVKDSDGVTMECNLEGLAIASDKREGGISNNNARNTPIASHEREGCISNINARNTQDICNAKARDDGNRDYTAALSLVTNNGTHSLESTFQYLVISSILIKILLNQDVQLTTNVNTPDSQRNTTEAVIAIGARLVQHLKIIQCNSFAISQMKVTAFHHCIPVDLGLGLFTTSSLMNHSCDPAVDTIYYGKTNVVRAVRNIQRGEEVTIDYGRIFYTHERIERQDFLKSHYFFDCRCDACIGDWPMWNNLECKHARFKCHNCGKELPAFVSLGKTPILSCLHCAGVHDMADLLMRLQESNNTCTRAVEEVRKGNSQSALPILHDHLSLVQSSIMPPWRDFYSCQATIKQCYRLLGNRSE